MFSSHQLVNIPPILLNIIQHPTYYHKTPMETFIVSIKTSTIQILSWFLLFYPQGNDQIFQQHTFSEIKTIYQCGLSILNPCRASVDLDESAFIFRSRLQVTVSCIFPMFHSFYTGPLLVTVITTTYPQGRRGWPCICPVKAFSHLFWVRAQLQGVQYFSQAKHFTSWAL